MTTFTISNDNNITAFAGNAAVPEGTERFTTQKDLANLTVAWPIGRLVEVWNSFAGVAPFDDLKPVKKFTDRKTAVNRIWAAIQKFDEDLLRASIRETEAQLKATRHAPAAETREGAGKATEKASVAQQAAPVAPKKARATKDATVNHNAPPTPRDGSKKAIILDLLKRADGATLKDVMDATDWQAHSVRGFISGALGKKMGITVESFKTPEGVRAYRIATQ